MRDSGPLPMLSTYAVRSSTASMSRKSSASVAGCGSRCQVAPPSIDRRMVLRDPLAQTTDGARRADAAQRRGDAGRLRCPGPLVLRHEGNEGNEAHEEDAGFANLLAMTMSALQTAP